MKKIFLFVMFVLCQLNNIQAVDVEGRVAYFYPQNNRIRDIYSSKGFPEYQVEVSTPLIDITNYFCLPAPCNWDAFANWSYYRKNGRSSCLHDRTRVTNWTLNFGVKRYFETCSCFRPYLGVGAGAARVSFNDHSEFVKQHRREWGFSFLAKSGIKYDITCNFFADLFLDYTYNWFSFGRSTSCASSRNVNTGGLKVGLGVGYQF